MLYQELNKTLPFDKRMEHIYNTIESIIAFADKEKLKYYICGGTGLAIYNRSIYRENEDLEFSIDYDQKDIWVNFLEKNEFKFEKHSSNWPLDNQKIIFRSKLQLKLELILLKDQKINKDVLKINIKHLNINIFDPVEILKIKFFYIKYDKKEIRTKDKIDILHFKQYFIDNLKNS